MNEKRACVYVLICEKESENLYVKERKKEREETNVCKGTRICMFDFVDCMRVAKTVERNKIRELSVSCRHTILHR